VLPTDQMTNTHPLGAGCADEAFHVLVVSIDVGRVMAARHAACGWPLQAHIEWTNTWHEAVRRARELPARLVIVDCDSGLGGGTSLVRHLMRHQPDLEVLAFAEIDARQTHAKTVVWPWSALPQVLDHCVDAMWRGDAAAE
jgi:hypothetical protein